MSSPISAVRRTGRTAQQTTASEHVSLYSDLLKSVRELGMLRRTPWFYGTMFGVLVLALGGTITGFVLLGDSWLQLLMAAALGIVSTQFAFLAHEAAHRQIFESNRANEWAGRLIGNGLVGMSYQWWMNKHSRHHANPNTVGKDPDIAPGVVAFVDTDAQARRGLAGWFVRVQGYFLFPMLAFLGLSLQQESYKSLMSRGPVEHRWLELALMTVRIGGVAAAAFLVLPFGMAWAFLGVQSAIFGIYMGSSFAPNHKGMPIIREGSKVDFFTRQVLTSRNIRGGWWASLLMGGLNHQTEHHLFPNMARPYLPKVSALVRDYAAKQQVPFTETSLGESYLIVQRYLNRVGLRGGDPFTCPVTSTYRLH